MLNTEAMLLNTYVMQNTEFMSQYGSRPIIYL